MKMSWGNCHVKVSSPHGDFYVEPEGIASARVAESPRCGTDHQSPSGDRAPTERSTAPAARRVQAGGAAALRHANRGRPSPRRLPAGVHGAGGRLEENVDVGFNVTTLRQKHAD